MGSNEYVWVCDLEELLEIGTVADHQIRHDHGDRWVLRLDGSQRPGSGLAPTPGRPTGWVVLPTLRESRDEPQRLAALPGYGRS